MYTCRRLFMLLCVLAAAPSQVAQGAGRTTAAVDVFRHVAVLPMDREVVLKDQAVVTSGGVIESVVPDSTLKLRPGMKIIDGSGEYLMPGLVDFHSHPNTPDELISYLLNGVTTVLGLDGERLEWQRRGYRSDPSQPMARLLTATNSIEGRMGVTAMTSVASPDEARHLLDRENAEGIDLIKTYGKIQPSEFKAVADWANAHRLLQFGHISVDVDPTDVFDDGLDVVAHAEELPRITGYHPTDAQFDLLLRLMATKHVALIPNLLAYPSMIEQVEDLDHFLHNPGIALTSPAIYQGYLPQNNGYKSRGAEFADALKKRSILFQRLTKRLSESGVVLLAGTDSPIMCCAGESLVDELRLEKAAGLSQFQTLQTAGFNSNRLVEERHATLGDGPFGVVKPGARADLILLRENPLSGLDALKSIDGVMQGGKWWPRRTIESALASERPNIQRGHQFVDRYEALLAAGDFPNLVALLDGAAKTPMPLLDLDSISDDADDLVAAGKPDEAIALLVHSQPLVLRAAGAHKVTGLLMMKLGYYEPARAEFHKVLDLAPEDATAKSNLRLIDTFDLAPLSRTNAH